MMNNYNLEDLKEELIKMEGWLERAEGKHDIMTIKYFITINKKLIGRLEGGDIDVYK